MSRILRFALVLSIFLFTAQPNLAIAKSGWVGDFIGEYPTATRLHNCGVCHVNFSQKSARNAYGIAFKDAGGKNNPVAGLRAIEGDDSDGDGTTNLAEIMLQAGFMPGYDCDNYTNTTNAPADLADYVDPMNVGCGTATTTSSTTTTTSLVTTTSLMATTSSTTTTSVTTTSSTTTTSTPTATRASSSARAGSCCAVCSSSARSDSCFSSARCHAAGAARCGS